MSDSLESTIKHLRMQLREKMENVEWYHKRWVQNEKEVLELKEVINELEQSK